MKTRNENGCGIPREILLTVLLLAGAQSNLSAQLVADGASATISAITNNITGDLVVGTNGSFTTLVITNAGSVTNSGNGIIGQNGGARTNRVIVTGANSSWNIGGNLIMGTGSSGLLLVTNGGWVENNFANLAFNSVGSTGNVVVVTGTNSVWTNRSTINIGHSGPFNRLIVTNGGTAGAGGAINIGNGGASNQLTVAQGGKLLSGSAKFGISTFSSGNSAAVTDPGSQWTLNNSELDVGDNSSFNRLVLSNGAKIFSAGAYVGANAIQSGSGLSNLVTITGPGSAWTNTSGAAVGNIGSFNQLIITNGGLLRNQAVNASFSLGFQTSSSNNSVVVTGTNSLLSHSGLASPFPTIYLGFNGSFNQIQVSNGGAVETDASVYLGYAASASNNSLTVTGARFIATNASGSAVLDVRRGSVLLDSGFLQTDVLLLTNGLQSQFAFIGGVLQTRSTSVTNGGTLIVGNGNSASPAAAFQLLGNGTHTFNEGLHIMNNATLSGSGTIRGMLTVRGGGTLAPGANGSAPTQGKITLANTPLLQGTVSMKVSKSGASLTNDQIQVATPLYYGSLLIVTNVGPDSLARGDNFKLFGAPILSGYFSGITLPSLASGLNWTNKLLVDGSIEVVSWAGPRLQTDPLAPDLGIEVTDGFPGWVYDVLTATNLPSTNWTVLASDYLDWTGYAHVNAGSIQPIPRQFFRVQTHAP